MAQQYDFISRYAPGSATRALDWPASRWHRDSSRVLRRIRTGRCHTN